MAVVAVALSVAAATEAAAQQRYSYEVTRTRTVTVPINWRPEQKTHERYIVSISPLRLLADHGLKFNFERELPRSGHWLGTSLTMYFAPAKGGSYNNSDYYNDRESFNSSFDSYHRMWGVGTSIMFKNTFGLRGWYFATGLVFDFFRVGVSTDAYVPYTEDGMRFYDYGRTIESKSYFKPTAQIHIGKHMAISERCFFDLYAGIGLSYSFYADDNRHMREGRHYYGWGIAEDYYGYSGGSRYDRKFTDVGGFAYRGLLPVGGFRFGVLLWKPVNSTK